MLFGTQAQISESKEKQKTKSTNFFFEIQNIKK